MASSFEELIAEAAAAPISGWDFTWLEGRASEERPSWHYSDLVAARIATTSRMLDLQCGGGEMLSRLPRFPLLLVATEEWEPNVAVGTTRPRSRGGHLVVADDDRLPFAAEAFDLVTSRHPIQTRWDEIARVLRSGGTYLSQQVGPNTVRELTEFIMGSQPSGSSRDPQLAKVSTEGVGLKVVDLRSERLRTVFHDVGAVVYFLRLVVWIVPDFTVDRYWDRLLALHEHIERNGSFVVQASRFLIEAKKAR